MFLEAAFHTTELRNPDFTCNSYYYYRLSFLYSEFLFCVKYRPRRKVCQQCADTSHKHFSATILNVYEFVNNMPPIFIYSKHNQTFKIPKTICLSLLWSDNTVVKACLSISVKTPLKLYKQH